MRTVFFGLWFLILSVPLSFTMGMHSLSLKPSRNEHLRELAKDNTRWTKLHFLGADCTCSEKVYQELLKRTPDKETEEKIFIIGSNLKWQKDLSSKGYNVVFASMDDFEKKYSIKAVPQLIILNDQKAIAYSGGYAGHRNPAAIEDQYILESLRGNKKTTERPIYGCINGSLNRKNADPLRLKY